MKSTANHPAINKGSFRACITLCMLASLGRAEGPRQVTATSYLERGTSFVKKGELDMAIADFGIALQFDPNLAAAYSNRGDIYYRKGEF